MHCNLHALVHKVPNVEDATPNPEEGVEKNRNSVAERTREKMASRAAS